MNRKEFTKDVVESILIRCRRHCAVCDCFCGTNIEIHHIDSPEDNSEKNAIPVCFNCHATIGHYSSSHPKGKKYTPDELFKLREICFKKYDETFPHLPNGQSDYGRGFHDGVNWAEKVTSLKEIWRFLSVHGDYAIENLLYFESEDTHTMMDETYFSDNVITEHGTQFENHQSAWLYGVTIGLWDLDGNNETLFITEKGKLFRNLVNTSNALKERYLVLKKFWDNVSYDKKITKPSSLLKNKSDDFHGGFLNWLQMEIYKPIRLERDKSKLYLIHNVTPNDLELKDIETGDCISISEVAIQNVEIDYKNGELILILK